MKYALFLLLMGVSSLYASNYPIKLGSSTVVIHQEHYKKGKAFIHLHQNETTALKAAKAVVKAQGGSVLTLVHSGKRNVVFYLHNKRYEFDPNRIFTNIGIKKTLMQYGNYSPSAHIEVKKLATKIKQLLPKGKVISVHNNKTYSLKNYLPGRNLSADARALNFNVKSHHRNFYLVTKKIDYVRLKNMKFNSILQTPKATNDGSLSVYLAGGHYINVEAGYDQLAQQIKMLKRA